jgi:hypothetical protein
MLLGFADLSGDWVGPLMIIGWFAGLLVSALVGAATLRPAVRWVGRDRLRFREAFSISLVISVFNLVVIYAGRLVVGGMVGDAFGPVPPERVAWVAVVTIPIQFVISALVIHNRLEVEFRRGALIVMVQFAILAGIGAILGLVGTALVYAGVFRW